MTVTINGKSHAAVRAVGKSGKIEILIGQVGYPTMLSHTMTADEAEQMAAELLNLVDKRQMAMSDYLKQHMSSRPDA